MKIFKTHAPIIDPEIEKFLNSEKNLKELTVLIKKIREDKNKDDEEFQFKDFKIKKIETIQVTP